ncbi:MAG: Dna2/Cas4 domain-containing protein [Gammaproteobacteria bacterium]|nr:Dna2/Cas4 domain-containing protein [Gammaproteobacteria bacterium]
MPEAQSLIRVMALHALAYCERLFYLEEVEEIRVADHRVYAGRTLHEAEVDGDGEWQSVQLESDTWGLKGKVDYVRYRDGGLMFVHLCPRCASRVHERGDRSIVFLERSTCRQQETTRYCVQRNQERSFTIWTWKARGGFIFDAERR